MKRAMCCFATMLAFASMSMAQDTTGSTSGTTSGTTSSSDNQSTMKKGHGKGKTLTGCVEQEQGSNEYILRHGKKTVELESSEDLKPHVGHTVRVSGTWDKSADKAEAKGGGDMDHDKMSGTDHKGMKGEHHFKVSNVEMVSDTCTATAPKTGGK